MSRALPPIAALALAAGTALAGAPAQVTKESVPGIVNFARLDDTVACAGAVTPSAVADVKKMGFKAIFNLRLPDEAGADIDGEKAAAAAAGLNFIHLPLSGSAPDPAVVDRFLEAMAVPGNQPAFVHCASGNRAAALWLVKRAIQDGWDTDRAAAEASALGTMSASMRAFALDYIRTHRR